MEKKMNVFDWNQLAPPKDEWVWAAYSLEKKDWMLVKTCRHGCCVHSIFGNMLLPNFWYFPSLEEVEKEKKEWEKIVESQIKINDLYE